MSDRLAGIVLVIVSFLYGLGALRLKTGFISDPIGPKTFPLILATSLAILGFVILLLRDPEPVWPGRSAWLNMGLAVLSFVIYAYLLVPIGFIAATTLATGFVSQRFGGRLWQALVTGVAVSLALYALFVFTLGIPLPTGKVFGG